MSDKSEYQKVMDSRILDMEACIGEHLSKGFTPELLIGTDRTITEIFSYLRVEPDWNNPEGRVIAFGDNGDVMLRIFRSVDVPYGTIVIR